ncbi:LCP family protein [Actinoplanes sp. NPDC048967]|uniref:LCP family protein n=1 Tax=Actinoplanes sp. NPDC048967 TaxID=3155269 RepID=UPI0033F4082C
MTPIEEELRATFERHEALTPAVGPVRAGIDIAWVRAKRRRLIRRAAGAAVAVLMAGTAVPVVLERWQHASSPSVPTAELFAAEPAPAGPLDVLLLGSDNRIRWQDRANRRADSVMIIHVPADRTQAYLISLPRDGEVKLPDGATSKLSETLFFGGPALTGKVVSQLTGVTFDATVTVDFRALRAVTEAVGGVRVCLPQAVKSVHNHKTYPKGCQQLTADDVAPVLQARFGLPRGSYDRDRNAQLFLRALAGKLAADGTVTDPARVQALVSAARDGLEITGDPAALLRAAGSLGSPGSPVGISERTFHSMANGREQIYAKVGPSLYAALRDDTLPAWIAANPSYVVK